jgi:hypothetical protein
MRPSLAQQPEQRRRRHGTQVRSFGRPLPVMGGQPTGPRRCQKTPRAGYLYFALLVARVAGALLVEASGSKAKAAALVNEWVNESVKIRARKNCVTQNQNSGS